MKIELVTPNAKAPSSLMADVDLHLTTTLKLTGICIWKKREGNECFVTFPGRKYKDREGQEKTFEFLRGVTKDDRPVVDALKEEILQTYYTALRTQDGPDRGATAAAKGDPIGEDDIPF